MTKSITIVIPAYNEAALLKGCLDSIAAQTEAPDEVILVDNNSTDQTAAIAASYRFVTVLEEPRQGVVFARDRGFDAATSDIIARIDADSQLPIDWVSRIRAYYADATHKDLTLTGGCYFYNLRFGRGTGRMYDLVVHRVNTFLLGYAFPWGSNTAVPAHVWRKVRKDICKRNDMHEDLDLGIHIHKAGFDTRYVPSLKVGAVARRIMSDRDRLWPYLGMWIRTMRQHHVTLWSLCVPISLGIWLASYGIFITEWFAGLFVRGRVSR